MAKQHRFDVDQTETKNVGRCVTISYYPHRTAARLNPEDPRTPGMVEAVFEIGEETGGVFTVRETQVVQRAFDDLPAGLQTTFDSLETTALNFGESSGILPSGTEEPAA